MNVKSRLVFAFLPLSLSCTLCFAAPPRYAVADLGAPKDGFSSARAINNRGQVMGMVGLTRNRLKTVSLWTNGKRLDFGTLPGYLTSIPEAINDRGEMTGEMETGHQNVHAFLARQGTLRDLGTLPGDTNSRGFAINARGDVRGYSSQGLMTREHRDFLFHDGIMKELKKSRRSWRGEKSINKRGRFDCITILGRNRKGDLTGCGYYRNRYKNGRQIYAQAFVVRRGKTCLLKTASTFLSYGRALNDRGDVVGRFQSENFLSESTGGACLWKNGKLVDLNALLPPDCGWHLDEAYGINDAGQIVGDGTHNGNHRAFLLTPFLPMKDSPAVGDVRGTTSIRVGFSLRAAGASRSASPALTLKTGAACSHRRSALFGG